MNRKNIFHCVLMATIISMNTDCVKDPPIPRTVSNQQTPPPPPLPPPPPPSGPPSSYSPPNSNAGADKLVFFPANTCNLYGSLSYGTYPIVNIQWRKITGPSSFHIENPSSLGTKVSNLEIGIYQFELASSDSTGSTDKDTCSVIVGQLSSASNEYVFENMSWNPDGLLWGSMLVIPNVYQYLPAGAVFRAYIKSDSSAIWEELIIDNPNSWFLTHLMNGNLQIWSNIVETDTPNIKLIY